MPDGIKVKPSTDSTAVTFHADEVAYDGQTALVQRIKIGHGAPGSYDDASSSAPLPVALDAATLAALETIQANTGLDLSPLATEAKLEAVRALLAGTLAVKDAGTYAYRAGTAAGTVDVPTGARLRRVSVLAGASAAATVTIGGGDTITIPAGGALDESISGDAVGADVVIGGTVQSYYVSWVA